MWTKHIENKKAIVYLFWVCLLSAAFIIFPNYLGLLISKSQWSILGLLGLGVFVVTLYFGNYRYIIFATTLFLFFGSSKYYWMVDLFATLRWVLLGAMATQALSNWIMGRVSNRFRLTDILSLFFIALTFYSQTYSIMPDVTFERAVSLVVFYLAVFWGVWQYVEDERKVEVVIYQFLISAFIVYFWGFCSPSIVGGRVVGFFGSSNGVGVLGSIVFPLALWSCFCKRARFGGLAFAVIIVSLLLSNSRAGFIGAGMGAAYFLSSYKRSPV